MPVSKNLAYDHPAYQVPIVHAASTTVGASGVGPKFAAFTAMQIKAVPMVPNIASTSASQPLMYVKSGTATSTTTLVALTSAAITPAANLLSTAVTLAQNDIVWITHGTDATASVSYAVEMFAVPGAALSV